MFATKKMILAWCDDFLEKKDGAYFCPKSGKKISLVRKGRFWKIEGKSEEYLWEIEDLKA